MVVRWLVFVLFAISTIGWNVSANLTDNSELTTMYLMCESSNDCYLSDEFSGQETLTGTINQASPFNPVTLLFEFEMSPKQTDLAILSDSIRFLQVDFHMEAADQGDWQNHSKFPKSFDGSLQVVRIHHGESARVGRTAQGPARVERCL